MVLGQSEEASDSTEKKARGRQTWIIATSLPEGVKSPITVLAGGKLAEVGLLKRSVGKSIEVPKDGLIQVVKPIESKDDKPAYEILAASQIPEGVKDSLIILTPVPNLTPPLKFKSKVVDLDKFGGGDALFVNLTNVEIGVSLGDKRSVVDVGQIAVMDTGDFTGTKNMTVSYHYRVSKEEKWNLINASTVPLRSTRREILIFSYNTELAQVDYHGISFEPSE